jgi:trehalose-6-phosphate synthase
MPQCDDESATSRLLIVSNRLPVTIHNGAAADFTIERSSGWLATAL